MTQHVANPLHTIRISWSIGDIESISDPQQRDRTIKHATRMRNEARANGVRIVVMNAFLSFGSRFGTGRQPRTSGPEQPATKLEGVIDEVGDKAIVFDDGRVITTDAATKYARLTDKGEVPAERKELKAGVRVRYELVPGKGATKVVILPAKPDGESFQHNGRRDE